MTACNKEPAFLKVLGPNNFKWMDKLDPVEQPPGSSTLLSTEDVDVPVPNQNIFVDLDAEEETPPSKRKLIFEQLMALEDAPKKKKK